MTGEVLFWRDSYGFIKLSETEDIFCHASNITFGRAGHRFPMRGQMVEFEVGEHRGKKSAMNVRLASLPVADIPAHDEKF